MIGAIAGDIVGSVYEAAPIKTADFPLFAPGCRWESTVRNAVSLGGNSDTMACIAGGIAEAFYGPVPREVRESVLHALAGEPWEMTERFIAASWRAPSSLETGLIPIRRADGSRRLALDQVLALSETVDPNGRRGLCWFLRHRTCPAPEERLIGGSNGVERKIEKMPERNPSSVGSK